MLNRGLDAYPAQRYSDLAAAYLKLGRTDEALSTITKAIELCGKQAGRECPGALNQRAEIHTALGDDRAALADVRAALDMLETVRARLVPADFFKQQFNHAQEGVYSHAIALELARGDARFGARDGGAGPVPRLHRSARQPRHPHRAAGRRRCDRCR